MRDPQAEPADLIRSVSRALRVLESVGGTPRGLTVKQIARRCELTVATTYHLVRTLAYEGYVIRRDDGTYGVGPGGQRPLPGTRRRVPGAGDGHRAAAPGRAGQRLQPLPRPVRQRPDRADRGGRGAPLAVPGGSRAGIRRRRARDRAGQGAAGHDAPGRAYPRTCARPACGSTPAPRWIHRRRWRPTSSTGERRGMQVELGQYRDGVGCASVTVLADRDPERRMVLAVAAPLDELTKSASVFRTKLTEMSKGTARRSPLAETATRRGQPLSPG